MNTTETVEIGSSDDEVETIEQDKPKPDNKTSTAKTDVKTTSTAETNKKLTITVEDEVNKSNLKSTKIVIEIDEVTSNKESVTEVIPSKKRNIFGIEYDVDDFTPEFMKLLDQCIEFEFSEGMTRILNRNLIPYYKLADKSHTKSLKFRMFLENIMIQMKKRPEHKFSLLKEVCMDLKSHTLRKRAQLITLDKPNLDTSKKRRLLEVTPTNQIVDVIDLDTEQEVSTAVIDLDNEPEDVIFVAEEKENLPIQITSVTSNFDVEQGQIQNKDDLPIQITSVTSNFNTELELKQKETEERIKILETHIQQHKDRIKLLDEMEVTDEHENPQRKWTWLSPDGRTKNEIDFIMTDNKRIKKLIRRDLRRSNTQAIEAAIEQNRGSKVFVQQLGRSHLTKLKTADGNIVASKPEVLAEIEGFYGQLYASHVEKSVLKLTDSRAPLTRHYSDDIPDVDISEIRMALGQLKNNKAPGEDGITTELLKAGRYKGEVVRVYKELCELTNSDYKPSSKMSHIKIHVTEGHPHGPAQKLQAWLKENREENGDLSFPDFIDIVKCVKAANDEDLLNWSKGQILKEARRLFIECGKALQTRRQKREWRDLVSKVKGADVERDPADSDPLLWAKLEDNRRIARRKEADILEHYSQLKPGAAAKQNNKITVLKPIAVATNSLDKCIEISIEPTQVPSTSYNAKFAYEVPIEYDQSYLEQYTEPIDQKPLLVPLPIDPSVLIVCSDSDDYSTTDDEHSDVEFDDLPGNNNNFNHLPAKVELFENDVIAGNDSRISTGGSEGGITQNNMQQEDNTENSQNNTSIGTLNKETDVLENDLSASIHNKDNDLLEKNISANTLNTESEVLENDTIAKNHIIDENITDVRYSQIEAVIEHAVATTVLPESTEDGNPSVDSEIQEDIKIKEEPSLSASETLRLMLEFDNSGLDNVQIKMYSMDEGEPQVCIEISSSDSESDDDSENELDTEEKENNNDLQPAEPLLDR